METNTLDIIYEDNHLIAVVKEAGELVQGDHTGDQTLMDRVKRYIKKKYNKAGAVYLGCVHRLDRPVSGLVLFAKTSKALTRMNTQFADREVTKTYFALVDKRPKKLSDDLTHWLRKDHSKVYTKASDREVKGSKKAQLSYSYVAAGNHRFLLKVNPVTGRSHQIRAQLAQIGCPISADLKYGSKKGKGHLIYLHSKSLEFIHPVKKERITLHCPLPDELNWNFFREYE